MRNLISAEPLSNSRMVISLYDAMVKAAKQNGSWQKEKQALEQFIDITPSITDKQHVKHILKLSLGTEANRVEALLVEAKTKQATLTSRMQGIDAQLATQNQAVERTKSVLDSWGGVKYTQEWSKASVTSSTEMRLLTKLKLKKTKCLEETSKNYQTIQDLEDVQKVNPQVDTYFSESIEATFESKEALSDPLHKDWLTPGTVFRKGATTDSDVSILEDVGNLLNTWFPNVEHQPVQFKKEVDEKIPLYSNFMSPNIFDWHLTKDHVKRWKNALKFLKGERTMTRSHVLTKLLEVMNGNDAQRETTIKNAFNHIWPYNDAQLTLSTVEEKILPTLRRYRIKENLFEGMSRDLFEHKYGNTDTNAEYRIDQLLEGPKVKLVWGEDPSTLEDIEVLAAGEGVLKRWMCHSNRPLVQVQNNRETMNGAQWTPMSIGKLCDVLEKEIKLRLPKKKEETTSTNHVVTASAADVRSTNPLDHVTESPIMDGRTIDKTFTESVQTSASKWLPNGHVLNNKKPYIFTICEPSIDKNGTHQRQYKLLAELYNIRLYVFSENGTEKNVGNLAYHSFGQLGNVPLAIKRKQNNTYVSMLPSDGYSKPSLSTKKSFASRWAILYSKSKTDTTPKKALLDLLVKAQKYAVVVQSYRNYNTLLNQNENKKGAIANLNVADLYELLKYANVNYVGKNITHTGNSDFTVGSIVEMEEFESKNETLQRNRQKLAVGSDIVIKREDLNQMVMTHVPDTLDFTNIEKELEQLRLSTQSGAEPESSPISLEGLNRVARESKKTAQSKTVTAKSKPAAAKSKTVNSRANNITLTRLT